MCFGGGSPPPPPPPKDPVLPAQPIVQQQPIGFKGAGRTEEDDKFRQTKAARARKKLRIKPTENKAGLQSPGAQAKARVGQSSGVQVKA